MLSVTARKIREQTSERPNRSTGHGGSAKIYTGYLVSYPLVGRGMVIFRDPHGHRMITTPVKRILGEPGGTMLYVETENSVYRIELHGAVVPVELSVVPASASLDGEDALLETTADESASSHGAASTLRPEGSASEANPS